MAVIQNRVVTAEQAKPAIMAAFALKQPVFLWGGIGIGKSELVAQIAREMGGITYDVRMAQMEPTDIRGMPYPAKNDDGNFEMCWAHPVDLPSMEDAAKYPMVVLFLDEMNSAAPSVQAAAYQLVQNRRVGTYVLPDNVVVIAAGNRESDKGVTYKMAAPLSNRFLHLEMIHDHASWETWATNNKIHPQIVGYLAFAKNDLHKFDAKSASRAFPTPRSWTFVSRILDLNLPKQVTTDLVAGCIGEGVALSFNKHREIAEFLPRVDNILAGTVDELDKRCDISAKYTLSASLCYALKEMHDTIKANDKDPKTDKDFIAACDIWLGFIMKHFEAELVVMATRVAVLNYKLPLVPNSLVNFKPFQQKYGKYIQAAVDRK